ncbi:uncharacterized protein ACR2FA_004278 [Aphomia sociella]
MVSSILLLCFSNVLANDDTPLIIKLKPQQVIESFKSVVSSKYLTELANDFAVKAAKHFLNEMKNKERVLTNMDHRTEEKENKDEATLLDEREAMTLLHEPMPDGDNFDSDATNLSEDETSKKLRQVFQ